MLIKEVMSTSKEVGYDFEYEHEGIDLVRQRINQAFALRRRIRELGNIPVTQRTDAINDELALRFFQLFDAKFHLDKMVARLKELQKRRTAAVDRA